jgi:hypothetical protein
MAETLATDKSSSRDPRILPPARNWLVTNSPSRIKATSTVALNSPKILFSQLKATPTSNLENIDPESGIS